MNTNIKTTQLTLTPAISDYVAKRLARSFKVLGNDPAYQCDVELAKTSGHHQKGEIFKAEVHIVGKGKNLYTSSEQEDLYAAIDAAGDGILRELKATKAKQLTFMRRGGARMKAMAKGLWPFKARS